MERNESNIKDGVVILNKEDMYKAITRPICPSHEEASCEEEYDYIKPNHYQLFPGMEDTFEIHKAYLTREEYIGWLKGTILKYKIRMGEKPGESYESIPGIYWSSSRRRDSGN